MTEYCILLELFFGRTISALGSLLSPLFSITKFCTTIVINRDSTVFTELSSLFANSSLNRCENLSNVFSVIANAEGTVATVDCSLKMAEF